MAEWTLITGATGFVGGEWTLKALLRGEFVAALVRPGRESALLRHIKNLAIAHGCTEPSFDRLVVVPWTIGSDFSSLMLLRQSGVNHIKHVIHAASDMSYSLKKLPRSLENNLSMALGLYQTLREHAPEVRTFLYVSTAYTCGLDQVAHIPESLHLNPKLVNGYQMSKWATEMSLSECARQGGPRLVILRPSIIVGEGHHGVYTGKCFGFYMFLRGFALAKKTGARRVRVAIRPECEINLISIDQVLELMDRLAESNDQGLIHATLKTGVRVGDMMGIIGESYGLKIEEGKPRTLAEHLFHRQVAANMAFANTTFAFSNTTARRLLPARSWEGLARSSFERIIGQSRALYCATRFLNRSDWHQVRGLLPTPWR